MESPNCSGWNVPFHGRYDSGTCTRGTAVHEDPRFTPTPGGCAGVRRIEVPSVTDAFVVMALAAGDARRIRHRGRVARRDQVPFSS